MKTNGYLEIGVTVDESGIVNKLTTSSSINELEFTQPDTETTGIKFIDHAEKTEISLYFDDDVLKQILTGIEESIESRDKEDE